MQLVGGTLCSSLSRPIEKNTAKQIGTIRKFRRKFFDQQNAKLLSSIVIARADIMRVDTAENGQPVRVGISLSYDECAAAGGG